MGKKRKHARRGTKIGKKIARRKRKRVRGARHLIATPILYVLDTKEGIKFTI